MKGVEAEGRFDDVIRNFNRLQKTLSRPEISATLLDDNTILFTYWGQSDLDGNQYLLSGETFRCELFAYYEPIFNLEWYFSSDVGDKNIETQSMTYDYMWQYTPTKHFCWPVDWFLAFPPELSLVSWGPDSPYPIHSDILEAGNQAAPEWRNYRYCKKNNPLWIDNLTANRNSTKITHLYLAGYSESSKKSRQHAVNIIDSAINDAKQIADNKIIRQKMLDLFSLANTALESYIPLAKKISAIKELADQAQTANHEWDNAVKAQKKAEAAATATPTAKLAADEVAETAARKAAEAKQAFAIVENAAASAVNEKKIKLDIDQLTKAKDDAEKSLKESLNEARTTIENMLPAAAEAAMFYGNVASPNRDICDSALKVCDILGETKNFTKMRGVENDMAIKQAAKVTEGQLNQAIIWVRNALDKATQNLKLTNAAIEYTEQNSENSPSGTKGYVEGVSTDPVQPKRNFNDISAIGNAANSLDELKLLQIDTARLTKALGQLVASIQTAQKSIKKVTKHQDISDAVADVEKVIENSPDVIAAARIPDARFMEALKKQVIFIRLLDALGNMANHDGQTILIEGSGFTSPVKIAALNAELNGLLTLKVYLNNYPLSIWPSQVTDTAIIAGLPEGAEISTKESAIITIYKEKIIPGKPEPQRTLLLVQRIKPENLDAVSPAAPEEKILITKDTDKQGTQIIKVETSKTNTSKTDVQNGITITTK